MSSSAWPEIALPAMRREALFPGRIVTTFLKRPAHFDALIRETVASHPDQEALVCRDTRLSYTAFNERLNAVAAQLQARGIRKGDRVGLLCDNSAELLLVLFGALRIGAIAVPMGTRQQKPELEHAFVDSGVVALVFDAGLADRLPDPNVTPALSQRFAVGGAVAGADPVELLFAPGNPAPVEIQDTDPALIMYTSGTTGRPKGAVLPHVAMVHSAMHFVHCVGHEPGTRALLTIPAAHISGLGAVVMAMLRAGGCIVIDQSFKADTFLDHMARERINFAVLVPAMYKLCLLCPTLDQVDLSAWRIGLFGGAIMPPATVDELGRRLPQLRLVNAYGATETTSPATLTPPGGMGEATDSIGRVLPCADIIVMDETGREVPNDTPGELWIGGPMVAIGYWNNSGATNKDFTAGYWHSGDIGTMGSDGLLRILDRKKDVINRAGYKVYSAEVENTLVLHPDVVEAVVVPRPCPVLGERVHAWVCARVDSLSEAELAAFCAARLSDYKIPETWSISTGLLPRNANGKFEKRLLAAGAIGQS